MVIIYLRTYLIIKSKYLIYVTVLRTSWRVDIGVERIIDIRDAGHQRRGKNRAIGPPVPIKR